MSIDIHINKQEPIAPEIADAPPEMQGPEQELSELTRQMNTPFNPLQREGNIIMEGQPTDTMLDPSTGTELPRKVGAELEDPMNSGLTKRAKQRMIQLKTVLGQRSMMNV